VSIKPATSGGDYAGRSRGVCRLAGEDATAVGAQLRVGVYDRSEVRGCGIFLSRRATSGACAARARTSRELIDSGGCSVEHACIGSGSYGDGFARTRAGGQRGAVSQGADLAVDGCTGCGGSLKDGSAGRAEIWRCVG
jgi:hypothetical protein